MRAALAAFHAIAVSCSSFIAATNLVMLFSIRASDSRRYCFIRFTLASDPGSTVSLSCRLW